MIWLNFGHNVTDAQKARVESLLNESLAAVLDISITYDHQAPFAPQVRAAVDRIGWSSEQWDEGAFLVSLPTLHNAAALVLAEIHGRIGHFPTIVRLRPVSDKAVAAYEVAELINQQAIRDERRGER